MRRPLADQGVESVAVLKPFADLKQFGPQVLRLGIRGVRRNVRGVDQADGADRDPLVVVIGPVLDPAPAPFATWQDDQGFAPGRPAFEGFRRRAEAAAQASQVAVAGRIVRQASRPSTTSVLWPVRASQAGLT